ncbi:MAG: acyl-CoA dehydrogenase [Acidobacteria bacterium]|nr:acyl-CoA dehydrogenase [Acidobacteriota bacterium]MCI0567728.1 acyl-CoA dehydrogenase [Acidobacteriota bacterium]
MNLELTAEHRAIREMVRDFAEKEIAPGAARHDRTREFPYENVRKCAALNLLGAMVSEEFGGSGLDTISYTLIVEELSRACASTGVIVSVNNSLFCHPVEKFGSEDQKRRFLLPHAKGEKLGCFCLSEPGAGSDAGNQQTTAVRKGDGYVLNGTKNFITNGVAADSALVFAATDKAKGHHGISAFIVEKGTPGFRLGKDEVKLGITCSGSVEMVFEDCRVGASNLLGEEGMGFKIAMNTLDGGRIGIAAQAVGIARACLEESTRYAKQRKAFGKAIAEFQAIQFMLADMATEVDAARLLTHRAAWTKDQGGRFSLEAAQAKLFASEVAMRSAVKAVQIFGGYGYMNDYPVERYFRDAKITEIYEGTSEIQRLVIAASLLKD